ncbi:MAG: hypothetical protein AB2A00_35620 [Myxococcota bacterium]
MGRCDADALQLCENGQWSNNYVSCPVGCVDGASQCDSVVGLSAGAAHTCAVISTGSIRCWGDDSRGQLGDDATAGGLQTRPVRVTTATGLGPVDSICAGGNHTCAVSGGQVWCWGANQRGQLGNGTFDDASVPAMVAWGDAASQVACGSAHTCAIRASDGALFCWGAGDDGRLGVGGRPDGGSQVGQDQATPVMVSALFGMGAVSRVALGGAHSCAIDVGGHVWCWGYDTYHQAANGQTSPWNPAPVEDAQGEHLVADELHTGTSHTCASLPGSGVVCWGSNFDKQHGGGTVTFGTSVPADIVELDGFTSVTTGADARHACGVSPDPAPALRCWGNNDHDQAGRTGPTPQAAPTAIQGVPTNVVVSVATGTGHSCAAFGGSDVRCWGWMLRGRLGNGSNQDQSAADAVPVVW